MHFLFQFRRWSSCLPAKFPAHVSLMSMQISLWGERFFTSVCVLPFPLPFFLSHLSSSSSLRLPPSSVPTVMVSFGAFIEKVGGRVVLKELKLTWLMRGWKSIIKSSTFLQNFADLQSLSQIWNLVLTTKRNLAGNSFEVFLRFEDGLVAVYHV